MDAEPIFLMAYSRTARRWILDRSETASAELEQLRVLTLNTWFEPRHRAPRYGALSAALEASGADVMCLQEVTPELLLTLQASDWVQEQCVIAASANVYTAHGVAILSRLPARCAWERPFSSTMNRGLLGLELSVGGQSFVVASAHFESTRSMRASRVHQLADTFAALEPHRFVALTGDFNFDPSEPEEAAIDPGYVDAWVALRPGEPGYTEDTARNPMRLAHHGKAKQVRYDRVLARLPGWSPVDVSLVGAEPIAEGVYLSDHFGVCASFARHGAT